MTALGEQCKGKSEGSCQLLDLFGLGSATHFSGVARHGAATGLSQRMSVSAAPPQLAMRHNQLATRHNQEATRHNQLDTRLLYGALTGRSAANA